MASFHSRSNSFPSQTHPIVECVEDHLCRLKASQGASTSSSSVSANLATLKALHEGINNLIQMPSVQQSLSLEQGECWVNEVLEGSLSLVDLCSTSRDIVDLTKESVHDLESSIRRNKSENVAAADINAYAASRKKINKMVNKYLKNLKSFNHKSTDWDLKAVGMMLKETESLSFSILKSVLIVLSGEKDRSTQRNWSFFSKFTQTSQVHSETTVINAEELCSLNICKSKKSIDSTSLQKILKQSENITKELEEGLESLFRTLVKIRVSLLNVLTQ